MQLGKYIQIAIFGITVVFSVFLWRTWLRPIFNRLTGIVPPDADYINEAWAGSVPTQFCDGAKQKAKRLNKALEDSTLGIGGNLRCSALTEAISWNANQLITISNAYKNVYGVTLFDAVDSIWGDGCSNPFGEEKTAILSQNLLDAGLS